MQSSKDKARQVFQRSAQQAGFFQYGNTKLVMPPVKATPNTPPPKNEESDSGEDKTKNGGGDGGGRHPLIEGLLRELPAPKSEWTTEDRKNWLEMASSIFNVVYKNSDDSRRSLRVVVENFSAKQ